MNDLKPWYQSKTIWGSLVAIGAALASALGYPIDQATQSMMVESLLQLATVGGSLFAIFGRLSATSEIQ